MSKRTLHEEIFGDDDYLGIEKAFKPIADIAAPNQRILSGELDREIFEDVFGKKAPAPKDIRRKRVVRIVKPSR